MKLFRLRYRLTLEKLRFEEEIVVPADSKELAEQTFQDLIGRAPALLVPHNQTRLLFPLQPVKKRVKVLSVVEAKDSK